MAAGPNVLSEVPMEAASVPVSCASRVAAGRRPVAVAPGPHPWRANCGAGEGALDGGAAARRTSRARVIPALLLAAALALQAVPAEAEVLDSGLWTTNGEVYAVAR